MKPISFKQLGAVTAERVVHAIAYDGSPFVQKLRCHSESIGWFEVDPFDARCSLEVGGWMTTRLHPSTWRSICSLFE